MNIQIMLKDPDGIYESLREIEDEELREKIQKKFFEFGDYCYLTIDTEAMTAEVQVIDPHV